MAKYAVVENGQVTNLVKWDGQSTWDPGAGRRAVPIPEGTRVRPGYAYRGGSFTDPAAPAPGKPPKNQPDKPATPRDEQFVVALNAAETLDDLKAALLAYHSAAIEQKAAARTRTVDTRATRRPTGR